MHDLSTFESILIKSGWSGVLLSLQFKTTLFTEVKNVLIIHWH